MSDRSMLPICSRQEWGALKTKHTGALELPATRVLYGCTMGEPCRNSLDCSKEAQLMQSLHKQKGLPDIRYSFMIGEDNKVYEGRGWKREPLLPKKHRAISKTVIYIAFFGKFTEDGVPPEIVKIANELVDYGVRNKFISINFESIYMLPSNVYYYYQNPKDTYQDLWLKQTKSNLLESWGLKIPTNWLN